MRIENALIALALTALAVAGPVSQGRAAADPTGGCYGGNLFGAMVPGTGSWGENVEISGNLDGCAVGEMPGATAATVNLSSPRPPGLGGSPVNGTITWNTGEVSMVDGTWQFVDMRTTTVNALNISSGPGSGHQLVISAFALDNTLNTSHPVYLVNSALFN